ncbi:MAG: hypothetical protein OEV28_04475 [Nitrospirota bacterium]|nr:hypothetical protein [Nitrospirota bacterium]
MKKINSIVLAGLMTVVAAGTGFAAEYANVITKDRFEAALVDQGQWASYKNVVTRDGFALALADQAEFGTYKNVMDADTFEAALVDQSQWASYKNIVTRDGFELAMVDHRVTGASYTNMIGSAEFEDALGDRCLADGQVGQILLAKCEVR